MSRCAIPLQRKYSGSLYRFLTSVSVDELIRAGVRVYWHINLYTKGRHGGTRAEELEEPKWKLARSQKELDFIDGAMIQKDGQFLDCAVVIYFDIKSDRLWKEVQRLVQIKEEKGKAYWRSFRESGEADRCAIARSWTLMGCDPAWYDRQTAPEQQLS